MQLGPQLLHIGICWSETDRKRWGHVTRIMFSALCLDIQAVHQRLQCSWILGSYRQAHTGQEQPGNIVVM